MRRIWWPDPLYEARPYGALALGLLAGAVAVARTITAGGWNTLAAAGLLGACVIMGYGAVILRLRFAYRRRSRWHRERRG